MSDPVVMQCMEVWGGSEMVQSAVSLAGLDCWVYSKPFQSAEAGGDVYYVSSCATGRIARLLIADVSGHGEGVLDTAKQLRSLMRRYVNHHDQTSFVRSMNRHFTDMNESGCFATAVVMTYFGPHNSLSLSNAGHPAPLWYRAKTKKWQYLERQRSNSSAATALANIPLGIEGTTVYDETSVELDVDDLVLCFSDSLIEARSAVEGELLMQAGLLEIVRTIDATAPHRFIESLISAILKQSPAALDGDDITVMLFSPNSSADQVSLKNRLRAPLRVARGVIRSLLPGGGPMPIPQFSKLNIAGALFDRFNRKKKTT